MTSPTPSKFPVRDRWAHYVAGAFVAPLGGNYAHEFNPRTGESTYEIAVGTVEDIHAAVHATAKPQQTWSALKPMQRGRVLNRIAAALRRNVDELA